MNPLALIPGAIGLLGDWLKGRQSARADDAQFDLDARQTYAAEYQPRGARFWFDALVDGVNRLIRPGFTIGVIALFWWAAIDPAEFSVFAAAISVVPDALWAVLAVIVSFWFGGRLIAKDMRWTPKAAPRPAPVSESPDPLDAPNAVEERYRATFWPD